MSNAFTRLLERLHLRRKPCPSQEAQRAMHSAEQAARTGKLLEEEGQTLRAALKAHIEANNFDSMLAKTFRGRQQ